MLVHKASSKFSLTTFLSPFFQNVLKSYWKKFLFVEKIMPSTVQLQALLFD